MEKTGMFSLQTTSSDYRRRANGSALSETAVSHVSKPRSSNSVYPGIHAINLPLTINTCRTSRTALCAPVLMRLALHDARVADRSAHDKVENVSFATTSTAT